MALCAALAVTAGSQAADLPLKLQYAEFDPLAGVPMTPAILTVPEDVDPGVYIVQFDERPRESSRAAIREAGGRIHKYVAHDAYVVEMTPAVRRRVETLEHVRWVGPFHPAYRLAGALIDDLQAGPDDRSARQYNIQVFERGLRQQRRVAWHVGAVGGTVRRLSPHGFRMEAVLTSPQLIEIAHRPEVAFIDAWTPPGADMDIVREATGANFVEQVAGYTGAGVAGEVLDLGVLDTHCDLTQPPILFHTKNGTSLNHGTPIMGILYGDGTWPRGPPAPRSARRKRRRQRAASRSLRRPSRVSPPLPRCGHPDTQMHAPTRPNRREACRAPSG